MTQAMPPVKFLKLHMIIKNQNEIYDIDADPGIIESIQIESTTDLEQQERQVRFSITFVAPAAWFGIDDMSNMPGYGEYYLMSGGKPQLPEG